MVARSGCQRGVADRILRDDPVARWTGPRAVPASYLADGLLDPEIEALEHRRQQVAALRARGARTGSRCRRRSPTGVGRLVAQLCGRLDRTPAGEARSGEDDVGTLAPCTSSSASAWARRRAGTVEAVLVVGCDERGDDLDTRVGELGPLLEPGAELLDEGAGVGADVADPCPSSDSRAAAAPTRNEPSSLAKLTPTPFGTGAGRSGPGTPMSCPDGAGALTTCSPTSGRCRTRARRPPPHRPGLDRCSSTGVRARRPRVRVPRRRARARVR